MSAKETFYPPEKCEQIRVSAKTLGLKAPDGFWKATPAELSLIFNGCGPDSWIDSLRCLASWVYRNFPEPIAIHDYEFQFSNGKPESLPPVNERFLSNSRIKLNFLYPFKKFCLYILRAREWSKMEVAYVALKNGSEEAWIAAHERFAETC